MTKEVKSYVQAYCEQTICYWTCYQYLYITTTRAVFGIFQRAYFTLDFPVYFVVTNLHNSSTDDVGRDGEMVQRQREKEKKKDNKKLVNVYKNLQKVEAWEHGNSRKQLINKSD